METSHAAFSNFPLRKKEGGGAKVHFLLLRGVLYCAKKLDMTFIPLFSSFSFLDKKRHNVSNVVFLTLPRFVQDQIKLIVQCICQAKKDKKQNVQLILIKLHIW